MKKFNELVVGDVVVEYIPNDRRHDPREVTVTKIGKKYFYTSCGYGGEKKYPIENGYGEYGYEIFPDTLEQYQIWKEGVERFRELQISLSSYRKKSITEEQFNRIKNILNE